MNNWRSSRCAAVAVVIMILPVAAQTPASIELRTPLGRGASHPLKSVLPTTHPLAKDVEDRKSYAAIALPDAPEQIPPDLESEWTEMGYDVAQKRETRGESALRRPKLATPPKHSLGLDGTILLAPPATAQRTLFEGDRKPITNTRAYPWRAVCKLYIKYPKHNVIGSGIMVGTKYLLTAGHCVYHKPSGGWAKSIEAIPGYFGPADYKPFGSAFATDFQTFSGWIENSHSYSDIALVRLDRRIGLSTGWLTMWDFPNNMGRTIHTAGYPGDLSSGRVMYYDSDKVTDEGPKFVRYKADTKKGQSGSGVWRIENGGTFVIAVNTTGNKIGNLGTKVTSARIASFNAFMRASP